MLSQLIYLSKKNGYAYPSQSYLKKHCGISLRTVQRTIKTLVDLKLISVKHEYVKGKKEIDKTIYRVLNSVYRCSQNDDTCNDIMASTSSQNDLGCLDNLSSMSSQSGGDKKEKKKEIEIKKKERDTNSISSSLMDYTRVFFELYDLYPVKEYKDRAQRYWLSQNYTDDDVEVIRYAIKKWSKEYEKGYKKEKTFEYFLKDDVWKPYKEIKQEEHYNSIISIYDYYKTGYLAKEDAKEQMSEEDWEMLRLEDFYKEYCENFRAYTLKDEQKTQIMKYMRNCDDDTLEQICRIALNYRCECNLERTEKMDCVDFLVLEKWKNYIK